jgi:uncharacterized protein YgiM (DUF1202 family)
MQTPRHNIRATGQATGRIGVAVLACMLITAPRLAPSLAQTAGPNLLDNPDFGWPTQTNANVCAPGWSKDNAVTPRGWTAYWTCKSEEEKNQDLVNREPEFRPMNADVAEQAPRVRSYPTAASFFNYYSLQRSAGLLQTVRNIKPGTRLRFSIWTQLWSTNGDDINSAYQPGGLQARACIDTTGFTVNAPNFASNTIVCGTATREYDKYVLISVEAVAAADTITVIFDTSADYPVKHNDVFADDAELVAIDGAAAPAAAAPAVVAQQSAPAAAPPAAAGAQAPAVSIKTPQANIRSAPSMAAAIIASAPQGGTYPATAMTADRQWFQIQFQGKLAFVHTTVVAPNAAAVAAMSGSVAPAAAASVAPRAAVPAAPGAPGNVDTLPIVGTSSTAGDIDASAVANTGASRLLVREAPGPSARIVGRVVSGTRLKVIGVSPDKKYWRVVYAGGTQGEGWVMVSWTSANELAQALLR